MRIKWNQITVYPLWLNPRINPRFFLASSFWISVWIGSQLSTASVASRRLHHIESVMRWPCQQQQQKQQQSWLMETGGEGEATKTLGEGGWGGVCSPSGCHGPRHRTGSGGSFRPSIHPLFQPLLQHILPPPSSSPSFNALHDTVFCPRNYFS